MSDETKLPEDSSSSPEKPERVVIEKLHLVNFTAFKDLEMNFSPGINAIIGENATGKTVLLKSIFGILQLCNQNDISNSMGAKELANLFQPFKGQLGRLIHRTADQPNATATIRINAIDNVFKIKHWGLLPFPEGTSIAEIEFNIAHQAVRFTLLPAKEILSNIKGLRSLINKRYLSFDSTFETLLDDLFLPQVKNPTPSVLSCMNEIEAIIQGKIVAREDDELLIEKDGLYLEITLAAEGWRKFATLWLLLNTGTIAPGCILLWDEPEANLNPSLMKKTIEIMLALQQMGVQIIFATHDLVMLKWLDLLGKPKHEIIYHALYRDKEHADLIRCESHPQLAGLQNNAILDVYSQLNNEDLNRVMERLKDVV